MLKCNILGAYNTGSYLKIKENRWGGALEHIIGRNMQAFCVNTPEDSRKLFEIMGQVSHEHNQIRAQFHEKTT